MSLRFLPVVATLLSLSAASPLAQTPTTVTLPAGTVIGSVVDTVEYYRGIPYAKPPVGPLRLQPPQRLESSFGTIQATGLGPACHQQVTTEFPALLLKAVAPPAVANAVFLGSALGNETEDCLTVSVMRPKGTAPNARLPVVFFMHGGGFGIGSAQAYNGSALIPRAVAQGKPFILVTVNYRLGAFGFLGGKEVRSQGVANLGTLDQRLALEWVADNIAGFGGNPDAVTIWGESAGSLSVMTHITLYDGNHKYKGRPLFRAGIMESGSILPAGPVDGPNAQAIFDQVAQSANCSAATDKLACLRKLDFADFAKASDSAPAFLSYTALALSYMPRPDCKTLTASTDVLVKNGKYAPVPVIVGDMEDEGSLFAVYQANITTKAALVSYLHDVLFRQANIQEVTALVDIYPWKNGTEGSPFGTGSLNNEYPEFKRLSAILGDVFFTLMRRVYLSYLPPSVRVWSFLASWDRGTPILGTFHTSDLPRVFYNTDDASLAIQDRYIAFASSTDPNDGVPWAPTGFKTHWPQWHESRQLMDFGANATGLIKDDFRDASFKFIASHMKTLQF